ncbi:Trans-O-hydroxybenzylidenepyruvate hydratase-aldolase [Neomoorella glycerini]|uniref:Trans-O-hydroxybenzylidenepyruvate hydratase-aldolase n=1 Tax=Neomoorella glycerini TaxID=55779 RepID=A0A6I5ZSZ7_9FIRM|nr:dihydrodipicolinate synthase family protein [Moorella glycerini]QGP93142.1 Trans-O-hydroxybenzylidenepyruvate hydratase-aldolase [Moorella glycerini]
MAKLPKLTAKDIKGIVAIMPTPVKEGANSWSSRDVVDLDEAARGADSLVRDGVDMLLVNGTFGEAATLTWEELKKFSATVVETVAGRIPVFLGATTLNTRDTIERARYFRDLGAEGLFLGRPMWCQMSEEMIVQFYKDVAEALPDMNILVYDNPEAFKGKIPTRVYAELAKIPQVVASKYRSVLAGIASDTLVADMRAVKGNIKLLPHDCDWYYAAKWYPEEMDACWSSGVSAGPAPVVALKKALNTGDWETAKQITDEINWAYEKFLPRGSFVIFNIYNIGIQKARFDAAGYIKAGPALPPYHIMPPDVLESARECGRRWQQLQEKYSKKL